MAMPMSRSRSALLPEGDRRGERDQRQRGGDLAERDVDRGASRQHLRQRAGARSTRPRLEPDHPVAEPARLLGVVADEDDRDLQLAPQLGQRRLDRVAGGVVEGRGRLVEQQDLAAAGRAPGPASPAAARRPRAWRRRARRTRGRGRRGARQRVAVELACRRARRRSARFDSTVPSSSAGSCGTSETSRRSASGS